MKYKFPSNLSRCADRLYRLRQRRREMQREVNKMKAEETALKNHIINNLSKASGGVVGRQAKVEVVVKAVPEVVDYNVFYDYVINQGHTHLANKLRPSTDAVREQWEHGLEVPGVRRFNITDLSVAKR